MDRRRVVHPLTFRDDCIMMILFVRRGQRVAVHYVCATRHIELKVHVDIFTSVCLDPWVIPKCVISESKAYILNLIPFSYPIYACSCRLIILLEEGRNGCLFFLQTKKREVCKNSRVSSSKAIMSPMIQHLSMTLITSLLFES